MCSRAADARLWCKERETASKILRFRFQISLPWSTTSHPPSPTLPQRSMSAKTSSRVRSCLLLTQSLPPAHLSPIDEDLIKHGWEEDVWYPPSPSSHPTSSLTNNPWLYRVRLNQHSRSSLGLEIGGGLARHYEHAQDGIGRRQRKD